MPIYEYKRPDGTTFEIQQAFSEDPLTVDPDSGVPVERVLHAPAVHFKGKGFYNTDYGTRKRQRENAASSDSSSSGDSGSSDSAVLGLILVGRCRLESRDQEERVDAQAGEKGRLQTRRGREVVVLCDVPTRGRAGCVLGALVLEIVGWGHSKIVG